MKFTVEEFRNWPHKSVTLLGTSGVGKSVLIKHVVGLLRPDAGTILVDGQDVTHLSEDAFYPVRKKCAMVFQHATLFVDELRFQRHRRLLIEPESISISITVARRDADDLRLSLGDAIRLVQCKLVVATQFVGITRKRGYQRTDFASFLEQHGLTIRKNALNFVFLTDDFARCTVERENPLAHATLIVEMNDLQRLGVAILHVQERALIAELFHGHAHPREPALGVLCVLGHYGNRNEQRGSAGEESGYSEARHALVPRGLRLIIAAAHHVRVD